MKKRITLTLGAFFILPLAAGPLHDAVLEACIKDPNRDTNEPKTHMIKELGKGADIDALDKMGRAPLHIAAQYGFIDIAVHLTESGADINVLDSNNRTPLHLTTMGNERSHALCAELLLDRGANLNMQDKAGNTPTHLAARNGIRRILSLLLQYKPDLELRNVMGRTPHEIAQDSVEPLFTRKLHSAPASSSSVNGAQEQSSMRRWQTDDIRQLFGGRKKK